MVEWLMNIDYWAEFCLTLLNQIDVFLTICVVFRKGRVLLHICL